MSFLSFWKTFCVAQLIGRVRVFRWLHRRDDVYHKPRWLQHRPSGNHHDCQRDQPFVTGKSWLPSDVRVSQGHHRWGAAMFSGGSLFRIFRPERSWKVKYAMIILITTVYIYTYICNNHNGDIFKITVFVCWSFLGESKRTSVTSAT